jgi:hypothetical protein
MKTFVICTITVWKNWLLYLEGSKLICGMWGQRKFTLGWKSAASGSEQRTSVRQQGGRWLKGWGVRWSYMWIKIDSSRVREVEFSIGWKILDANTKGVLVRYTFVSIKFSGFWSFLGQFKFEVLWIFQDLNQEGVDTLIVTVSHYIFPVDDAHTEVIFANSTTLKKTLIPVIMCHAKRLSE